MTPRQHLSHWRAMLTRLAARFGPLQAGSFALQWAIGRKVIVLRPAAAPALYCRRGTSDLLVLLEMFHGRQYEFAAISRPRVIIDAGANVGYAARFFATQYPDARIIAIEPDADNFAMLLRNCAALPQVSAIQAALWPDSGPGSGQPRLVTDRLEAWKFRVVEGAAGSPVETRSMAELRALVPGGRVDLLKIDIEGGERALFEASPGDWLPYVGALIVETHDDIHPGTTALIADLLTAHGFTVTVDEGSSCLVYAHRPDGSDAAAALPAGGVSHGATDAAG